ncbi:MAG TPA: right-handed parallel beta-helix repeat-containing protein, partial [Pirellulales bacterium]
MHPRFTSLPASLFPSRRRVASRRSATRANRLKNRRHALASPAAIELLESRRVLATLYVAPSFSITNDVAPSGLSNGDTVTWDSGNPDQQTGLTFGANAFTDLQAAVNGATSGDTIRVAAGLYQLTSAVDVTKSLTILGPQADVDPRPSAGSARVAGGPDEAVLDGGGTVADTFVIGADNVTINGFDLRNTLNAVIDTNPAAVYASTQILDNFVHHALSPSGGKGIRFQGVTNGIVKNNDIYDVRDDGVEVGSGSAGSSPGAVVSDNEIHDLGSNGTSNSALYAFAVPYATNINVTFQGNLIYNFGGNDAIKVGSKNGADRALTGGSVLNNVVHDVVQDGITINTSNTLVQGNEVYNSSSDNAAIYVEHSNGGDTIANNFLHNNTAATATILIGDLTTAPTGVVVTGNSIVNNAHNTLLFRDLGSGATVDASANWWGSADSAVVAASVISTTPGQIDFTPWLNSGTDASTATPGFQP